MLCLVHDFLKLNWTDAEINDAIIAVLNVKYPNAPVDPTIFYNITFAYYKGPKPTGLKTFVKSSTGFVLSNPQ
ncbi:hypothetical protein [Pedobacter nutrimenti]|uniref:hypothetical protein n=1 Tax=Pedobacter nutrimenti TaxID=1241337 RepID=UPI00292CC6D1|nr:hypothetical protein [Pedobacter nutrimenti]